MARNRCKEKYARGEAVGGEKNCAAFGVGKENAIYATNVAYINNL
jgi:hypothetical protein